MFAFVGLGNPGSRYAATRHNVGFRVIDHLCRMLKTSMTEHRWHALTATARWGEHSILLAKPMTYMNRSGIAVAEMVRETALPLDKVVCFMDDSALVLGALRLRTRGSSGGHNGLEDILQALDTQDLPRLRVGIGPPPPGEDMVSFVLSAFTREEDDIIESACRKSAEGALYCVDHGLEAAMRTIN